jgi:hypothetical protein
LSGWPADASARSGQAIQVLRSKCYDPGVAIEVLAVKYQDNFVKVMLDATGDDELVAYVPERMFFSNPTTIGDVVEATWHAIWPCRLARPLAKTSSPTV